MKRFLILLPGLLCVSLSASSVDAATWTEPLNTIQKVGKEGEGNVEAAAAWDELTKLGSEAIIPILSSMEGASPLARNWMRSAAETIFSNELEKKSEMPALEIKGFLENRENDPNARRLAFDLLKQVNADAATALIPTMVNDPSPPLRREAVTQLINKGKTQLGDEKKEESIATLTNALDAARDVDQINEIAKLLRGDLEQKIDLPKHFGFLSHWHLIAPFDNTGREGFDVAFPPEKEIDLAATYPGKENQEVSWVEYATPDDYGMVDFNQPFDPLKEVVGYAYTEYESAEERPAELRLGCKNAWKIWFNGEYLFGRDEYHRGIRIDQYTFPVTLKKGKNTILVKACQSEQEQSWTVQWQFQLRVCDSTGTAILASNRKPTPEPESKAKRRSSQ